MVECTLFMFMVVCSVAWVRKRGYLYCPYSGFGKFVNFPNTIVFRHTNELRNYSLTHTTTKVLYLQLWKWFVLGAARLVVFRVVGCLRRNGLAGCWDGSVLLDVWGKYSKSPCSFVCRERSDARIDIVNFWGDKKWYLWKACWMFLIYVPLGFLVKNP